MELQAAFPEIFILFMILIALILDALKIKAQPMLFIISMFVCFIIQRYIYINHTQTIFNNMFILDRLAQHIKLIIYLFSLLAVSHIHDTLVKQQLPVAEFYILFLFVILGMLTMVSAYNLLVLYLGLEILSLSLYALIALSKRDHLATEAAIKLFILGALASGFLLYGISFIYGATNGTLGLADIVFFMLHHQATNGLIVLGLALIMVGITYKLALVPFHAWAPDVYQGAPLASIIIIGGITKLAVFVFVVRFLINGLVLLSAFWINILLIICALSLIIGNLGGLMQYNLKRMLGYSAIANIGFAILGFSVLSIAGVTATLFYIISYSFTVLTAFGALTQLEHLNINCNNIANLSGLAKRKPLYAAILMIAMLSMAGLPPLVGFFAKFNIIQQLILDDKIALAILAIMTSLIGIYYYLRVIKTMYFDKPLIDSIDQNKNISIILIIQAALLLATGLFPNYLLIYSHYILSQ